MLDDRRVTPLSTRSPMRAAACRPSPASPSPRRWWVIAGWIAFIIGVQVLAGAAAGRPTRTSSPCRTPRRRRSSTCCAHNGQGGQTGQIGTVVVHAKHRHARPRRSRRPGCTSALRQVCAQPAYHVAADDLAVGQSLRVRPAAADRAAPAAQPAAQHGRQRPRWSPSTGSPTRTTRTTSSTSTTSSRSSRTATVQYEFTGGGFANLAAEQKGIPPEAARLHRRADHPGARVPDGRRARSCRCSARPPRSAADSG